MKPNPFKKSSWNEKSLLAMWDVIRDLATNEYHLDFYEPAFEIVTFKDMLHIHTTGFPIMYTHWEFGQNYEALHKKYSHGHSSIPYEVIFNSNPALCYLLETNSPTMMALVMAHAAVGHSSFFKINQFMRDNSNADLIVPIMKNFKEYCDDCENKYGLERVETLLDVAKALTLNSMDRSEKIIISKKESDRRKLERALDKDKQFSLVEETLNSSTEKEKVQFKKKIEDENFLKFIAKYSPILKPWERELFLRYCEIQQYFYPQYLTKLMNEGYASFWHYTIMTRLHELKYLSDGQFFEFLSSHTSVLYQYRMDDNGMLRHVPLNPYAFGYGIFNDIKRICETQEDEDLQEITILQGMEWKKAINFAAINFKDESFVSQYLSKKLIRDFKLFAVEDNPENGYLEVTSTHVDDDFKNLRNLVSKEFNIFYKIPEVKVLGADLKYSRKLNIKIEGARGRHTVDRGYLDRMATLIKVVWPYSIYFTLPNEDASITY